MTQKYYKVVTPELKSIGSLLGIPLQKFGLEKQYSLGKWTCPKPGTDLFVFDNLENAQEFMWGIGFRNYEIYEVEVKEPNLKGLFINFLGNLDEIAETILEYGKQGHTLQSKHILSDKKVCGTVFCQGVKLIKKVEN